MIRRRPHLRLLSAAVLLSVSAVGLAGCGDSSSDSSTTDSSSTGSSDGTTDPGAGDSSTAAAPDVVASGKLTVCSDVPYAPFEDFDTSAPSGFKGFDIDIVSSIADTLGLELVVQDSDFDALQSGLALKSGQCDVAASAMTITDDRKKNIDFSDPYYDSEQSLLVPEGSDIAAIGDLGGKKVGVQKGTTGKSYTEENAPDAEIITFPSDAEMFQALKGGQVDALLQDLPVNLEHEKAGGYQVVETYKTDEQYGLAMAKGNTGLVDAVDAALQGMKDDGSYQKIYDTYFATSAG